MNHKMKDNQQINPQKRLGVDSTVYWKYKQSICKQENPTNFKLLNWKNLQRDLYLPSLDY